MLTYTLRGSGSLSELRAYADEVLRPALEQVEGVAAVDVKGGAKREIRVELDRGRVDALRLSLPEHPDDDADRGGAAQRQRPAARRGQPPHAWIGGADGKGDDPVQQVPTQTEPPKDGESVW